MSRSNFDIKLQATAHGAMQAFKQLEAQATATLSKLQQQQRNTANSAQKVGQ